MAAASIVSSNVWNAFMCAGMKGSMDIYMFCQSSAGTLTAIDKLRTVRMYRLAI